MPRDQRDYRLELSTTGESSQAPGAGRPFLGVKFACCGVYTRIYRNAAGTHYQGRCPKCGQAVSFRVGEGGTDSRFFIVR